MELNDPKLNVNCAEKKQGIFTLKDATDAIKESGIAGITNQIINCDCLEVMKTFPDRSIDLVLTDPPYNAKNIGPNQKIYEGQRMQLPEKEYREFCQDWFYQADRVGKNLLFTPGISNVCFYPQPYWIIAWHKPAAVSFNRMGGFNAWEPICFYGKMPKNKRLGQDYILCNTMNFTKGPEKDHPCPKPIELWKILVDKFSNEDDLILDPFLGSGTTSTASKQLHRRFIGIEISERYCQIARERLRQGIFF
jgi:site-specific DNA-methyltransferase (adenine-specific)/modification methylase